MKLKISKILSTVYVAAGNFRTSAGDIISVRHNLVAIILTAVLAAAGWAGAFLIMSTVGENLAILHYNVIFGVNLIGEAARTMIMPLAATIALILNFCLAAAVSGVRDRLLTSLLLYGSLVLNALIIAALYCVYLINLN